MVKDIEMGMEVAMSEETTVKSPKSCEASEGKCGRSVCTFYACAPVLGGTVLLLAGLAICSQSGHFGRRLCCADEDHYGYGHCGARCGFSDIGDQILPIVGFFGCRTNFCDVWDDCWNCITEGIGGCLSNKFTCFGTYCNPHATHKRPPRGTPRRFCGTTCCAKKNGGCFSIFEDDNGRNPFTKGYTGTCKENFFPKLRLLNMFEGTCWGFNARWSPFQCLHDAWNLLCMSSVCCWSPCPKGKCPEWRTEEGQCCHQHPENMPLTKIKGFKDKQQREFFVTSAKTGIEGVDVETAKEWTDCCKPSLIVKGDRSVKEQIQTKRKNYPNTTTREVWKCCLTDKFPDKTTNAEATQKEVSLGDKVENGSEGSASARSDGAKADNTTGNTIVSELVGSNNVVLESDMTLAVNSVNVKGATTKSGEQALVLDGP